MQKATYTHSTNSPNKGPIVNEGRHESVQQLWRLLDALAFCRGRYDLTTNSLSVLRALISFLPKDAVCEQGPIVVWPSNKALAERADGMDERTLRRHLAKLCKAGLIERKSSSNGKRFALRVRKTVVAAFGFNIQPLLDSAAEILHAAEEARALEDQILATRKLILNLLFALRETSCDALSSAEEAEIRRQLRRNASLADLLTTRRNLEQLRMETSCDDSELSANHSQNDRHQQNTKKDHLDSVAQHETSDIDPVVLTTSSPAPTPDRSHDLTLQDCLEAATESIAFAQEPVRTWDDLVRLADTLAPMIGIERELADHTRRAMGLLPAAISILCLIQRGDQIHKPAAYLRKLAILAENGLYSLKSLVRKAQRHRFAAVN